MGKGCPQYSALSSRMGAQVEQKAAEWRSLPTLSAQPFSICVFWLLPSTHVPQTPASSAWKPQLKSVTLQGQGLRHWVTLIGRLVRSWTELLLVIWLFSLQMAAVGLLSLIASQITLQFYVHSIVYFLLYKILDNIPGFSIWGHRPQSKHLQQYGAKCLLDYQSVSATFAM